MAMDISEIRNMIAEAVETHGWWVQSVLTDREIPSFSYTVGLTETCRHPELLMMGYPPSLMHGLLNDVGNIVREGASFSDWSSSDKVIAGAPVIFRSVPDLEARRWSLAAGARYKDYKLLQVFLPDKDGRFPWNAGCDAKTAKLQGGLLHAMPKPS